MLDTGLHTVGREQARRPERSFSSVARCTADERDARPHASGRIPIDDEDEPDDDGRSLDFEAGPRHVYRRNHYPSVS